MTDVEIEGRVIRCMAILSSMYAKNRAYLAKTLPKYGPLSSEAMRIQRAADEKEADFKFLEETVRKLSQQCTEHEEQLSIAKGAAYAKGEESGLRKGRAEFLGDARSWNRQQRELARDASKQRAREMWPELY